MRYLLRSVYLLFLGLISFFHSGILLAQNPPPVPIGQWREHIPYNKALFVQEANDRIYCASEFGLFSYNKSDGSIQRYSILSGLSDYEITRIRYDRQSGILMIAYDNSNVDMILPDESIYNLSDIKRSNIVGGKSINDITFINNFAYLSCEFGIVVVDLVRKEVKDTYFIGNNGKNVNVKGIAYDGTEILAVADSGIYRANYNDPNIFNFTAWTKDTALSQPNADYTSTTAFNGHFYAVKTNSAWGLDTVLVFENGTWHPYINNDTERAFIDSYDNHLVYVNIYRITVYDTGGNEFMAFSTNSYANPNMMHGILGKDNTFWIADFLNGLIRLPLASPLEVIVPNSPKSEAVWDMRSSGGYTWVASGSMDGDKPNYNVANGSYLLKENNWTTFNRWTDPLYNTVINLPHPSPCLNSVAIDPNDPTHCYFASWGVGVLEYRETGGVRYYNETNSILKSKIGIPGYVIAGGVAFDDENNLWIVAGGSTTPLYEIRADGTWQSFLIPDADFPRYGLYQVLVDDYKQVWMVAREGAGTGQGLGVFSDNDPGNPNDNNFKRITSAPNFGGLHDMLVRCIAKDKDGSIWIGTNSGISVIYNPGNVFSTENFDAQRIIIEQDGYAQYLLETEIISAIAIDGSNRKWIGTYSGGVFLMSADGTQQLLKFNTDNSPLPSNSIQSICIDEVSGEVFFGTNKGIFSYRGDATEGGETCSGYFAFPNPVRHDYNGPIAIKGLVANADVKITDISGNLVYHVKANGGQAIWYGTNFKGERVQTGVYTVFISNDDGTQTCVTKVLFAN